MKFLKAIYNGKSKKPYSSYYLTKDEINYSRGFTDEEIGQILNLKVRQVWSYVEDTYKLEIKRVN